MSNTASVMPVIVGRTASDEANQAGEDTSSLNFMRLTTFSAPKLSDAALTALSMSPCSGKLPVSTVLPSSLAKPKVGVSYCLSVMS